jgi:hypothetical protein
MMRLYKLVGGPHTYDRPHSLVGTGVSLELPIDCVELVASLVVVDSTAVSPVLACDGSVASTDVGWPAPAVDSAAGVEGAVVGMFEVAGIAGVDVSAAERGVCPTLVAWPAVGDGAGAVTV